MISTDLVDISRLQFAVTALYHFLFVPLTLGMTFLLVIMEGSYLITGQQVYKDMTRFCPGVPTASAAPESAPSRPLPPQSADENEG